MSRAKSFNINGFNIYQMRTTNIIRIFNIDHSKCSHAINVGDAILKIDGITIDNWSYNDLTQYLCNHVITSIETIEYLQYKKRKINNDNKDTYIIRGPRGPYKKKNICNNSGTLIFTAFID